MMSVWFYVAVGVILLAITALTVTIRLRNRLETMILLSLIMLESTVLFSTVLLAFCIVRFA